MPIRILPVNRLRRKTKRGKVGRPAPAGRREKKYHDKTTAHKSVQHPHSKLKTQKELKAITDSTPYKKADYKSKTEMLGGKVYAKGGRAGFQHGGRTNLLEELGRVEAEPSNRNRRAEVSRIHGELNKGYKSGGRIGLKSGKSPKHGKWPGWPKQPLPPKWRDIDKWKNWRGKGRKIPEGIFGLGEKGKPHSTKEGKEATMKRAGERLRAKKAVGGRIKKGNGGSTMQQHYLQHGYGPHKIQLRSGKPKLAKKGW